MSVNNRKEAIMVKSEPWSPPTPWLYEPEPEENHHQGDDDDIASLKTKIIAKLEKKLLQANERFNQHKSEADLARLIAANEISNHKTTISALQERHLLMEEDLRVLRDKEQRYQETICSLRENLKRTEKDLTDKIVALTRENLDLERARLRAAEEASGWKKRCAEMEETARAFVENLSVGMMEKTEGLSGKCLEEELHNSKKRAREMSLPVGNGAEGILPSAQATGIPEITTSRSVNQNRAEVRRGINRTATRVTNNQFLSMVGAFDVQKHPGSSRKLDASPDGAGKLPRNIPRCIASPDGQVESCLRGGGEQIGLGRGAGEMAPAKATQMASSNSRKLQEGHQTSAVQVEQNPVWLSFCKRSYTGYF